MNYSCKLLSLLSFFLMIGPLKAQVSLEDWSFEAQTKLYAQSIAGDRAEAQVAGTSLELFASHQVGPSFLLDLSAALRLENGSHKSLDIDEFAPEQQVLLNHATVSYTPFTWVELKAGAINQEYFRSPLFVDSNAFVASRQELRLDYSGHRFFVRFQQAIPNNQNLSTRLGSIDEGTPSLFTESIGHLFMGEFFKSELSLTSFGFRNLSNSVAHQSRFMGNSVQGIGQDSASFDYKFRGFNLALETWIALPKSLSLDFNAQVMTNQKAPDSRADARWAQAALNWGTYSLSAQYLYAESDSSVAFYNNRFLGHNNRKGFGLGLGSKGTWGQLTLDAIQTQTINPNIFQADATVVMLEYVQTIGKTSQTK